LLSVSSVVGISVFVYHRFIRPRFLSRKNYRVSGIREINRGVWDIELSPAESETALAFFPGQFSFVTFHRKRGLPEEEHHWTMSSSPAQLDSISFTIKELGDFTATIGKTRIEDTATLHGAFGRFSYTFHPEEDDFVFVAGGIGITPIMSMIRHMRDTSSAAQVLLIYANRNRGSIAFRDELAEISRGEEPHLKEIHILSDPDNEWEGEKGRIDAEKLNKYCDGRFAGRAFYLCGPTALVGPVTNILLKAGVPSKRIHTEIFSFLD
jgi:predicted ferric reductase